MQPNHQYSTYSTTICGVDLVDQVYCKVVFVGLPWHDGVAFIFQRRDDHVNSAKYWRMWENLFDRQYVFANRTLLTHIAVTVVEAQGQASTLNFGANGIFFVLSPWHGNDL
jgi:hypothetical protein